MATEQSNTHEGARAAPASAFTPLSSTVSYVNSNFNPLLGVGNAARLAAVVGMYQLWQKKKAGDVQMEESSCLSEIPRKQASVTSNATSGETPIYRYYRSPLYPEPLPSVPFAGVYTMYDNFQRGVQVQHS